jgi:hypothetical protein
MTVVVEESDDEWVVWPLGKAPHLGVVIKLLLILHYYWFCNNVIYGLRFEIMVCKLKLCKTFALLL